MYTSATTPNLIVVFDLDGTLLWTEKYWIPVLEEITGKIEKQFGYECRYHDLRNALKLLGTQDVGIYMDLFPETSREEARELARFGRKQWQQLLEKHPFQTYPHVHEVLEALQESGYALGVSSNCQEFYLETAMQQCDLGKYFPYRACAGMYPGMEKPEFTIELLKASGIKDGFFVGDKESDMEAGKAAGLSTIWAAWGYGDSEPEGTDAVASEIKKVPALLRELSSRA